MSCNQATRETITGSWGNGERAWVCGWASTHRLRQSLSNFSRQKDERAIDRRNIRENRLCVSPIVCKGQARNMCQPIR